jgi:hypothetical protein
MVNNGYNMEKNKDRFNIERIALVHFKKHRDLLHIPFITKEDVLKNFQNSFKFIMTHPRFDKDFERWEKYKKIGGVSRNPFDEDAEFLAYWEAQKLAMSWVDVKYDLFEGLTLIHCPILGSRYEISLTSNT